MSDLKPIDIPQDSHDAEKQVDQPLIQFTDLQNDQKQASVPQISNIQEIDKHEEERSSSLSKRQPQNSSGFNDFFNENEGTHHEITGKQDSFQPLAQFDEEDDKHSDRNNLDIVNGGECNDPKQMLGRFLGTSKKRDGDEVNWEDILMDIFNFIKKPSVIITIALLSILMIMSLQYNSLQREFRDLSQKLRVEQQQRGSLQSQMRSVNQNMKNVQKVEKELQKKETKLEKEMKDNEERQKKDKEEAKKKEDEDKKKTSEEHKDNGTWGESGNADSHEIHMEPLVVHRIGGIGGPSSLFDAISHMHDKIRSLHESIMSGGDSSSTPDDGQPHVIKIRFGNPFGPDGPFGSSGPFGMPMDGPDIGGLGEPVMPHFLGLEPSDSSSPLDSLGAALGDPFGP